MQPFPPGAGEAEQVSEYWIYIRLVSELHDPNCSESSEGDNKELFADKLTTETRYGDGPVSASSHYPTNGAKISQI